MNELRADQITPHSIEAEEAVLGSILINPEALWEVLPFLKPGSFFIVRHAWIWEAMLRLHERRDVLDYLTVVHELELTGRLAEVGGAAYVLSLINQTPSALNVEGYGRIVERMAVRRRLIEAAQEVARVAHSEETPIEEIMTLASDAVLQVINEHTGTIESIQSARAISEDVTDEALRWREEPGDIRGLATGLYPLDMATGGFEPELLYEISGRPGMGKSALIAHAARGAAEKGVQVIIFSLEMNRKAMIRRMAVQQARVSATLLKQGRLTDEDWWRFNEALNAIGKLPLWIEARSRVSVLEMRAIVRKHERKDPVGLVIIDTLNRVRADGKDAYHRMTNVSHDVADWAHESPFSILSTVQLSRVNQQSADKRPTADAFRDSGAVEEDADWIGGLYREYYYARTEAERLRLENENKAHLAELLILKNRDGESDKAAEFYWDARSVSFERLERTRINLDAPTTFAAATAREAAR